MPFFQAFIITLVTIGMSLFAVLILLLEPMPQRTREVQQQQPLQLRSPSLATLWTFDAWRSPPMEDLPPDRLLGAVPFDQLRSMHRFPPPTPLTSLPEPGSMATYLDQMQGKIADLWKPPPLRTPRQLSVVVTIRMEDSGQLTSATVARSSGDKAFDESALRAIRRAPPFPPLPMDLEEPLQVELRFHASRKGRPLRTQAAQENHVSKGESAEINGDRIETERLEERLNVAPEHPHPS
ncbi:MAG: TonB C-terminal domain-containing protein [candidate division NC10 bacterium]|nr:TonB C-terminal domain-containing protein [candidate division NC10 bacterium]